MFTVYKITNKINQKSYIGSSIQVEERWKKHIQISNNPHHKYYNYPLYQAFRKYGVENFIFEILKDDFDTALEMQQFEQQMILIFDTYGNNGYNQTLQTIPSEICVENRKKYIDSIKQKCAKVDKNENIIEIYESYHDAARKNFSNGDNRASTIRDVCKGVESSCLGNIFRDLDENGKVISKPLKKYKNRQPVVAIPIDNPEELVYFDSVSEAAQKLQTDRCSIQRCIKGDSRYSVVKNHIIRQLDDNGDIIENDINIDDKIWEYEERFPIIHGERHSVTKWCEIYGISRYIFNKRRNMGMSVLEALTLPVERR